MTYFDCYIAPVPRKNGAACEELARISDSRPPAFDGQRLIAAGFTPMLGA